MYFSKHARNAFAVAATLGATLMLSSGANAADFGGDCCADLEERIAELEATTARKGNRKMSLFIYGEVNQAVMFWDDRAESNAYVVTNSSTKNKLGFEGQAKINSDWTAGFRIELDLVIAPSSFVDQGRATFTDVFGGPGFVNGLGDDGNTLIRLRHANWFLKSERLGRLIVGQGSQATDGIAEIDLSGSEAAGLSSVEAWNETFYLRDENGFSPQVVGRTTIGSLAGAFGGGGSPSYFADLFIGNLDGGRGNFVHYISPTLAGFTASAAWGEDDDWDVALRYAGQISSLRVAAGVGYREGVTIDTENLVALTNTDLEQKAVVASGSVLHEPTGLFVSLAGGHVEYEPVDGLAGAGAFAGGTIKLEDAKYFYVKGGLNRKFNPLGKTSIYGEYYTAWDVGPDAAASPGLVFIRSSDEFLERSHVFGVGVVQHIDAAAMEIYAAYRHYWADDVTDYFSETDVDIQMDVVMTGARIKF